MRRTSAHSGRALSVLRHAGVTLASLAANAVATAAVLALALGGGAARLVWPHASAARARRHRGAVTGQHAHAAVVVRRRNGHLVAPGPPRPRCAAGRDAEPPCP